MTTTVRLTGISKRSRGTTALAGSDLTFGAGKTTLLRIIATVLAPDEGGVHLLGHSPDTTETLAEVRRQLGYLPQEMGFPRGVPAFGFVDYMAVLKEWTERSSRHDEVRRVLGLVDLADVATKRVRALSGGQRRRVALAQALLGAPELLLLDEPTTGVDPQQRVSLRRVLSQAGERSTVLLSTHQTEDVAALCDRVVVLDQGSIRFDGAVPGAGFSTMPRISVTGPSLAPGSITPYLWVSLSSTSSAATMLPPTRSYASTICAMQPGCPTISSSGRSTANGSSPTMSRAHQTA